MNKELPARIAGILMIGVFLINVYLGLADTNLSAANMTHYYLNWVIAVVSIIAAIVLILKPRSMMWVALGGIIWPIVYVISLVVDVETYLCLGGPSANCFPSHTSAFDYLILNQANIKGAPFGWIVAPVVPIALVLLVVAFILSIYVVYSLRKRMAPKMPSTAAAPGPTTPSTPSGTNNPGSTNQPPQGTQSP